MKRPNIVLVITDDQGYGDLSCEGNPVVETPAIDRFHDEAIRLTNFHVGPTCAPTRAGLLSGLYSGSVGVWHTIGGRSIVRRRVRMLPQLLRDAGYRTGLFGKWHLGDTYPYRPQDRGFETVVTHGGGGVGQQPDHWGNDYFDDTYEVNGTPTRFEGYCTDVWFAEARKFIATHREEPFFCYISPNAPHSPYNVPARYYEKYRGRIEDHAARFYGMITNIDENFAALRRHLADLGLEENTILIFMADNGTSCYLTGPDGEFPREGHNAGLRGGKGSAYDGGHRVPFYLRWPAGGLGGGRDIDRLTANIDLLPTLAELCGIQIPDTEQHHGTSLAPLLRDDAPDWPDRVIVTESQRVPTPIKWRKSCVMTDRWRLIEGRELYDITTDRMQRHDIAARHPDIVESLRREYESWWQLVYHDADEPIPFPVGEPGAPAETILHCMDWRYPPAQDDVPWHQGQIRRGVPMIGHWEIDICAPGRYRIELRRWPREVDRPLGAGVEGDDIAWNRAETDPDYHDWYTGGRSLPIERAVVTIGSRRFETPVDPDASCAVVEVDLPAGFTTLAAEFHGAGGLLAGAYYAAVARAD
ncbi:MAG: N-acetylgalactosamine-4-sulfatase [Verrucomicrobia bacterium]|nr:MAG: N-acetylgalactosamine-4-sulfatase [Verrucomicrobiota bacterium]